MKKIRVACAIIEKDGRILISKRKPNADLANYWEFPGGKCKRFEIIRMALRREIQEELGISLQIQKLIKKVNYHYSTGTEHWLYFYACKIHGGKPQPRDTGALMWLLPEELLDLDFPPANRDLISYLFQPKIQSPD